MPFCLLVKRKCKCCLFVETCARSGNKCRPCSAQDELAQRANASLEVKPEWPADAMERYDAVVPHTYAAVRQSIARRDARDCERDVRAMAARASMAAVLSVRDVCRMSNAPDCAFDAQAGRWVGAGCSSHV